VLGGKDAARCHATFVPSLQGQTSPQSNWPLAFAVGADPDRSRAGGLGSVAGVYNEWIVAIFGVNLGVSVAAILLARPAVFRSWVPWVIRHSMPASCSVS